MTIRLHIERLIIDPKAMSPDQTPQFHDALVQALTRLHAPTTDTPKAPRDAVGRLAETTARAIHNRILRT